MIAITPEKNAVGWASSLDNRSHFDDPNIHVGFFRDNQYSGMLQFNLDSLPPASHITWAGLVLVGLADKNLGDHGTWRAQILDASIDEIWSLSSFEKLQETKSETTFLPELTPSELHAGNVTVFTFGAEQTAVLERHIPNGVVSLRLDGPAFGDNNLFTWASGFDANPLSIGGTATAEAEKWHPDGLPISRERLLDISQGDNGFTSEELKKLGLKPVLWVVTRPGDFVIITPTPTPENQLTAVAVKPDVLNTATPLPVDWVTPIIVTATPLPANNATATYYAQVATAAADAFGTATATPLNVWTATPTPYSLEYEYVTSTPTPENIVTRAAVAATATYNAALYGTSTPVPTNWATPYVVTPHPTPENVATAVYFNEVATAESYLYGMIWTATPTAIFAEMTPVPTFTPTPGYQEVPPQLVGKIVFLSDRAGSRENTGLYPLLYAMDPDGRNVKLLSGRAYYDSARARDHFSADLRFRAFVQESVRAHGVSVPEVYYEDYLYSATQPLASFENGIAYDPVWSPTMEKIAFVSNSSGNDDIWVINRDGTGLKQLTFDPNYDKSPSWSPDGKQIIFWSNRTGKAQIWIMNVSGENQKVISPSEANDWNPVWIKYTDVAPMVSDPTPTPRNPFDLYN